MIRIVFIGLYWKPHFKALKFHPGFRLDAHFIWDYYTEKLGYFPII